MIQQCKNGQNKKKQLYIGYNIQYKAFIAATP